MRRMLLLVVAAGVLFALPAAAQNTDIEALAGLQFNFGNPGARSLGMGGAFIGLADDASAAEANPAGLTILRKMEFSVEGRNYVEKQSLVTSGIYPEFETTNFSHYSNRVDITFASAVFPVKNNFTFGLYYHQPLRNQGTGAVIPTFNQFGRLDKQVPSFYMPAFGGPPMSAKECDELIARTGSDTACFQFLVNPFLSSVDVEQRTFGLAGAFKVGKFSFGAAGRYQTFQEEAFTYRINAIDYEPQSIAVQSTAIANGEKLNTKPKNDVTFTVGVKWGEPSDKVNFGAVYKKGPTFLAPTFIANANTSWDFVKLADTQFHIPDVAGVGISFRPIPVLTINADAVRVSYTNLIDDFVSVIGGVQTLDTPYSTEDVIEAHIGAEYFFSTKIPFAIRGGYWRDPAHTTYWTGPVNTGESIGASILYPKGEAQNHFAIGAGLAWPKFQVDFGYDTSDKFKVGSISFVKRF